MAEELQHLIERIQSEAVQKADVQAAAIVEQARQKAAALVAEAQQRAQATLQQAEQDAKQYQERSIRSLEQAGRDLVLSVGQGLTRVMDEIVKQAVDQALDTATLQQMMLAMAQAYAAKDGQETRFEFLVAPAQQEVALKFFAAKYQQHLAQGVVIRADDGVHKGFKVNFGEGHVAHHFTDQAIAEALGNFLRPQLAAIVQRAAKSLAAAQQ